VPIGTIFKKGLDRNWGFDMMDLVMAKSVIQFEHWHTQGAQAPQFHTALFLCPCDSPGGAYAGAFGLAGFLEAGCSTVYAPPFFVLKHERRIS